MKLFVWAGVTLLVWVGAGTGVLRAQTQAETDEIVARTPHIYLASHRDLIAAYGNDVAGAQAHYYSWGRNEGRKASFNPQRYKEIYGDLASMSLYAATMHYINAGYYEGRQQPLGWFQSPLTITQVKADPLRYIASHGDLINAYGANGADGLDHFVHYGRFESSRNFLFEPWEYLAINTDVLVYCGANPTCASQHYIQPGFSENRNRTGFNYWYYLAANPTLIPSCGASRVCASRHYAQYGYNQGLGFSFNALRYIASHASLIQSIGVNAQGGVEHYVNYGYNQGLTITFDPQAYMAANPHISFGSAQEATIYYIRVERGEIIPPPPPPPPGPGPGVFTAMQVGSQALPHNYQLSASGKLIANSVSAIPQADWPDYVFQESYTPPTLHELEAYVRQQGHLPFFPSQEEMHRGQPLLQTQVQLLEAVENLTLQVLELDAALQMREQQNETE